MRDPRGPWYLLTGLVIGVALGILYAWIIQPAEYENTPPASLRADFKDRYRALISLAYVADGDPVRAKARLELLHDTDSYRALAEQAQRALADGAAFEEAQALGRLAEAIREEAAPPGATLAAATPFIQPLQSQASPTPIATIILTPTLAAPAALVTPVNTPAPASSPSPNPSATPLAGALIPATPTAGETLLDTPTPSLTPGLPFTLAESQKLCDQSLPQPTLQVQASDAVGQPVPGLEITIASEGGEGRFFTGLKPELGLGYADYTLTPGVIYTIRLGDSQPVPDITAVECLAQTGERSWGALLLVFQQR